MQLCAPLGIFHLNIRGKQMKKKLLTYVPIIMAIILADMLTKGVLLYAITGTVPLHGAAWEIDVARV